MSGPVGRRVGVRLRRWLPLAVVLCAAPLHSAEAQVTPPDSVRVPRPTTVRPALPDLPAPLAISPGTALWRAFLVPGWGHLSIGSYARGGFYFGAQAATVYTLLRARTRIGEAQNRVRHREAMLRAAADRDGVTDVDAIQERLEGDADLSELNNLLESRHDQQEDLVAMSLFLILISGVDAYVSAHLARFPDPIELDAVPTANGGVEVGLRVPLPSR